MRKVRFVSMFLLLALLSSAGLGVATADGPVAVESERVFIAKIPQPLPPSAQDKVDYDVNRNNLVLDPVDVYFPRS